MKRREFITLLGGVAATWPVPARAQQQAMPVVGFLHGGSSSPYAHQVAAFRQGLSEVGYVESRNVTIEYRFADDDYDRLPALAANLVDRGVNVIFATGGIIAPLAAKRITPNVPIVFTVGSDPVKYGLVAGLGRPGGNVTGMSLYNGELVPKRVELLREVLPQSSVFAALVNPKNPNAADAKIL